MLSKNREDINEIKQLVNVPINRIVDVFLDPDKNAFLSEENLDDYMVLLNEFIYLGAEEDVNTLLELKHCFNRDISLILGNLLINARNYCMAAEQLIDALNHNGASAGEVCFKIGFCYYKMSEYVTATGYMERALQQGYNGNDIRQFLHWIQEKMNQ